MPATAAQPGCMRLVQAPSSRKTWTAEAVLAAMPWAATMVSSKSRPWINMPLTSAASRTGRRLARPITLHRPTPPSAVAPARVASEKPYAFEAMPQPSASRIRSLARSRTAAGMCSKVSPQANSPRVRAGADVAGRLSGMGFPRFGVGSYSTATLGHSRNRHPAVHRIHMPGNHARFLRSQEHRHVGDVLGLDQPHQMRRRELCHPRIARFEPAAHPVGHCRGRGNRVDSPSLGREFNRHRTGDRGYTALRGGVAIPAGNALSATFDAMLITDPPPDAI